MQTDSPSSASRIPAGVFLVLAAGLLAVGLVPVRGWESLPDLCLFHRWTGLPCPTCGMTRSWSALLRGQLSRSFHYHALGAVSLLAGLVWLAWRRLRPEQALPPRPILWLGACLWVCYSLGRLARLFPGP